eukprot:gene6829-395_t
MRIYTGNHLTVATFILFAALNHRSLSSASNIDCNTLNIDYCFSESLCLWDPEQNQCTELDCFFYNSPISCIGDRENFGNCEWNPNVHLCQKADSPSDCSSFTRDTCPTTVCQVINGHCRPLNDFQSICSMLDETGCDKSSVNCTLLDSGSCIYTGGACSFFAQEQCKNTHHCQWSDDLKLCWPEDLKIPCKKMNQYTDASCNPPCVSFRTSIDSTLCLDEGAQPPCEAFRPSYCPENNCDLHSDISKCLPKGLRSICTTLDPESCSFIDKCDQENDICFDKATGLRCTALSTEKCSQAASCRRDCINGTIPVCIDCTSTPCEDSDITCMPPGHCSDHKDESSCTSTSPCLWCSGECLSEGQHTCYMLDKEECLSSVGCVWNNGNCELCSSDHHPLSRADDGRSCEQFDIKFCPRNRCFVDDRISVCSAVSCALIANETACLLTRNCKFDADRGNLCYNMTTGIQCHDVTTSICNQFSDCFLENGKCESKNTLTPCVAFSTVDACSFERCQWLPELSQCYPSTCIDIIDLNICQISGCTWIPFVKGCFNTSLLDCSPKDTQACPYGCWGYQNTCRHYTCTDAKENQEMCITMKNCVFLNGNCYPSPTSVSCDDFETLSCPPWCKRDYEHGICRKEQCRDYEKDDCKAKGCIYKPSLFVCDEDNGSVCETFLSEQVCPARCHFDGSTCRNLTCSDLPENLCEENNAGLSCQLVGPEMNFCIGEDELPPCHVFDHERELCPSSRCSWIVGPNLCWNETEEINCMELYTENLCALHVDCQWTHGEPGQCLSCSNDRCGQTESTTSISVTSNYSNTTSTTSTIYSSLTETETTEFEQDGNNSTSLSTGTIPLSPITSMNGSSEESTTSTANSSTSHGAATGTHFTTINTSTANSSTSHGAATGTHFTTINTSTADSSTPHGAATGTHFTTINTSTADSSTSHGAAIDTPSVSSTSMQLDAETNSKPQTGDSSSSLDHHTSSNTFEISTSSILPKESTIIDTSSSPEAAEKHASNGISTGPLIGGVVAGIGLAIFIITFAYVRLHQLRQIPFNRQKDTIEEVEISAMGVGGIGSTVTEISLDVSEHSSTAV